MEIEHVTLVVKRSLKKIIPTDGQKRIQAGSRSVALHRFFDLKHREIHLTEIILKVRVVYEQYALNVPKHVCEVLLRRFLPTESNPNSKYIRVSH